MYQKHHNHTAHFAPSVETLKCPVFSSNIIFCTLQSVTLIQSSNSLKSQNYGMSLSASQNWEYTVIYEYYFSIYYLQQVVKCIKSAHNIFLSPWQICACFNFKFFLPVQSILLIPLCQTGIRIEPTRLFALITIVCK